MTDRAKATLLLILALITCFPAVASAGFTSLHHASGGGHMSEVKALIAAGADVNAKDEDGHTPLHRASINGHAGAIKILLAAGADMNAKSKHGFTPLYAATINGHAGAVELLKAAGANMDAKGIDDLTDYAVSLGAKGLAWISTPFHAYMVIKLLLILAVCASATYQERPLHEASREGHVFMVKLLLDAGADVNAKDNEGFTPLRYARMEGHPDVVELLKTAGGRE